MCLGGGAKSSCQRVLWTDGSASYSQMGFEPLSLVTSTKSLSVVPQNTGGWTQNGSFSLLGMEGSYFCLGLLSSWRCPVARRRDSG